MFCDPGVRLRFTPTRVGTTRDTVPNFAIAPVHPHARGDNISILKTIGADIGSPPRAWGQRNGHQSCGANFPVHPHARGDNGIRVDCPIDHHGSPPRAWGQHLRPFGFRVRNRFTPTRVGTTIPGPRRTGIAAVHPHARGDNTTDFSCHWPTSGSPPRAWGQRQCARPSTGTVRFTPTRVGTTNRIAPCRYRHPVHPHARGDNSASRSFFSPAVGSPPRAWGQLDRMAWFAAPKRFTPTRVGTTSSSSR